MPLQLKALFLALALLKINSACAQTETGAEYKADSTKLIRDFLTGIWQEEADTNRIEFKISGNDLQLIDPHSYYYQFFEINSFPIQGVSLTWPPNDCQVHLVDKNWLKVIYTCFGGTPISVMYKKARL
jgi:hypothetical protein